MEKKYDWYTDNLRDLQEKLPDPHDYVKRRKLKNYSNVVTDVYKIRSPIKIDIDDDIPSYDSNMKFLRMHKYRINFTPEQKFIIHHHIKEYVYLYNLCIDIWKKYKNITYEYSIVKDVLFDYVYRNNTTPDRKDLIRHIIYEFKKRHQIYKEQQELLESQQQEHVEREKKRINTQYEDDMKKYKETIEKQAKEGIYVKTPKPKKERIKLIKPPRERKVRRQNIKKPAPDELLKSSIDEFCKNLKTEHEKLKLNSNYRFKLNYKTLGNKITIPLNKRGITEKGFFLEDLKEIECERYKRIYRRYANEEIIKGKRRFPTDCKLSYDSHTRHFTFYVPIKRPMVETINRKSCVGLDPGESIFMTYYSNEEYGKIGDNPRKKIKKLKEKSEYYQSVIDKGKNKEGKDIRNTHKIKSKQKDINGKIKGYVNEIHKKGAKYLCERYDRIMIPKFETQSMISNHRNDSIKNQRKQQNLNKEVKYVLNHLSHYTFREFLMCKAQEYGTKVYMVDEHYTSLSCIKCGTLSKNYIKREKICTQCGYTINRDIGGSRNIYCKSVVELKYKIHPSNK